MNTTNTNDDVTLLGEFGLIDRFHQILGPQDDPDLVMGIGDDAAVYRVGERDVHVLTTDALIEGVHFNRNFMPWDSLGYKSIAVNVSDVAAMNALPRYATVALAMPHQVSLAEAEAFYRGAKRACEAYGLALVGGDVTAAGRLMVSVTVVGDAGEDEVVYRKGARPGDLLCVTGQLGGAYAGLKVLLRETHAMLDQGASYTPDLDPYRTVIARQLTPAARVDVVRQWAERGFRPKALIDISDGLASEVHHLCRHSGCGALIEVDDLPIHLETRAVADQFAEDADTYALMGGEDYELLFAVDPADTDKLIPGTYHVVGQFTEPDFGVRAKTPEGDLITLDASGYQHFDG